MEVLIKSKRKKKKSLDIERIKIEKEGIHAGGGTCLASFCFCGSFKPHWDDPSICTCGHKFSRHK